MEDAAIKIDPAVADDFLGSGSLLYFPPRQARPNSSPHTATYITGRVGMPA
jgi:hypothetical protein